MDSAGTKDRRPSGSSHSMLDDLPTEKNDPLFNHLRNVEAISDSRGDLVALHQTNTDRLNEDAYGNGEEYDLEAQSAATSTLGKYLTRRDTAAWVTKHPSRIPDDGTHPRLPLKLDKVAYFSDEKEGDDVYRGIRGS